MRPWFSAAFNEPSCEHWRKPVCSQSQQHYWYSDLPRNVDNTTVSGNLSILLDNLYPMSSRNILAVAQLSGTTTTKWLIFIFRPPNSRSDVSSRPATYHIDDIEKRSATEKCVRKGGKPKIFFTPPRGEASAQENCKRRTLKDGMEQRSVTEEYGR